MLPISTMLVTYRVNCNQQQQQLTHPTSHSFATLSGLKGGKQCKQRKLHISKVMTWNIGLRKYSTYSTLHIHTSRTGMILAIELMLMLMQVKRIPCMRRHVPYRKGLLPAREKVK